MSVNVLVIPEDFCQDQYMLKPIIQAMMDELGVRSKVRVCTNPRLRGVRDALKWERIEPIIEQYRGMVRIFILAVDRDCDPGRAEALRALEDRAREALGSSNRFFVAENAWQELEVWVLAGMKDLPPDWSWKTVREERDPKERYYDPYARARGVFEQPYQGRDVLAREAARSYARIRQLCAEDVQALEDRIRAALASG